MLADDPMAAALQVATPTNEQLYIPLVTIVPGILLTLLDHVMLENTVSCPFREYHQPELDV